jgi:hypothetical protein
MPAQPGSFVDQAVFQQAAAADGWYGSYLRVTYDFAVSGGAISTILLGPTLPINTVVFGGAFHVITTFAGAAGTLAIGLNTTTDLQAATAIATYGTTGVHALVPVFTAASAVVLTAARQLQLTIATTPVSAGKMVIWLATFPSAAA